MEPGTKVQFVGGPFGLVDAEVSLYKFVAEDIASDGEQGTVVDPEQGFAGGVPEGWLLVRHERTGYHVPVHPSMVRPL